MTLCEKCADRGTCQIRNEEHFPDENKITDCTAFKQRVDVLCLEYSDTAWDVACKLINSTYEYKNLADQDVVIPFFPKSDLLKIGEHLVNYCKTEGDEP